MCPGRSSCLPSEQVALNSGTVRAGLQSGCVKNLLLVRAANLRLTDCLQQPDFPSPAGSTCKGLYCSPILFSVKEETSSTVHLQLSFYTCEVTHMGLTNQWEAGMEVQKQLSFTTEMR